MNQPEPDPQFGTENCTCIPFVREGGKGRYCRPGDTVDMISGWERGSDCPDHAPAPADQAALRDRIVQALKDADYELPIEQRHDLADAVLAVLPAPADQAAIVAELLPAWEAVYEPGNVSDYLIGYANDETPAKAAAEAWLRSQAEVTGRLEWVPEEQLATGRYDRWFELVERHADGIDTGPGLIVRRRVAAEAEQQPETEAPPVCEGFQWIGQSFATCERCAQPAWEHVGEEVPVEGAAPFDPRRTVRPWKPGQADAIRAKWDTTEEPTP